MTKLEDSTHWSVNGTLTRADKGILTGEAMDNFIDLFCLLAEEHGLQFNGGWMPLSEAQINGETEE